MQEAWPIGITIIALVVACVCLLLHHRYKHRHGGQHPLNGADQWFQLSDVGNFHSCSHEMWIVFMSATAFILSLYLVTTQLV